MTIDIQVIAAAAGVRAQVARYVVDQRLVPNARRRLQESLAGRPPPFFSLEGFSLGCAAPLYGAGVQRKTIEELYRWLAELPWPPPGVPASRSLLRTLQHRDWSAQEALYRETGAGDVLRIGNGVAYYLYVGEVDTGWYDPRAGA